MVWCLTYYYQEKRAISARGQNIGVLLRDTGNEEKAMKPGICRVPYRSNLGLISVLDSQKHQPNASPGIAPWIRKKYISAGLVTSVSCQDW